MAEERVQRRLAEIPGAGVAGNAHILAKGQWLATIAAIVIGFAAIISPSSTSIFLMFATGSWAAIPSVHKVKVGA